MHVCACVYVCVLCAHMHTNMYTFACTRFANAYVCAGTPLRKQGTHMCVHTCTWEYYVHKPYPRVVTVS